MKDSTFITKVVLKNYKSIAECDVKLGPLTFLVGTNGAGKSNFLDALRFVADALLNSLPHALRNRGGIKEVRRHSGGHPTHFGIRLDFSLREGKLGYYAFQIASRPHGEYEIQNEECILRGPELFTDKVFFRVKNGVVTSSAKVAPSAVTDRLYLVNASGLREFRPVYEAFSNMGFYNLNVDMIRSLQSPEPDQLLLRDGSNLTSILNQIKPQAKERIEEYLAKVVPGVDRVNVKPVGHMETLEFRQQVAGSKYPWRFIATNMSDGTLRALGILVALFQTNRENKSPVSLVGIEEPEVALHPSAAGVLLDSLQDASSNTQVIITSHSPDLMDSDKLDSESILAVVSEEGNTSVAPLDAVGRSVLRDRLYTAGELLRINQLVPDPEAIEKVSMKQLRLFDKEKHSVRPN